VGRAVRKHSSQLSLKVPGTHVSKVLEVVGLDVVKDVTHLVPLACRANGEQVADQIRSDPEMSKT
jgi:hypothetical protein